MGKIIKEGLTDIVYHFTSFSPFVNILRVNKFYLNATFGNPIENKLSKERFFYISLTRDKAMGFYMTRPVKIVLDGRKLNSRYKSIPVDYFNELKEPYNDNSESEDRIITYQPFIGNALEYILEVHVYIDEPYEQLKYVRLYNEILGTNNIPIYYYDDINNYKLNNKKKSVVFPEYNVVSDTENYDYPFHNKEDVLWPLLALISYNEYNIFMDIMKNIIKPEDRMDFIKYYEKINNDNDYLMTNLGFRRMLREIILNKNNLLIPIIDVITKDMRRLGVKSLNIYIDKKYDKRYNKKR